VCVAAKACMCVLWSHATLHTDKALSLQPPTRDRKRERWLRLSEVAACVCGFQTRVRIPDACVGRVGRESCERGQGHHYRVAPRALVTRFVKGYGSSN
jgi:hypothetical protein